MVVYVLVSGLLRTFTESLFPILCELANRTPTELILCTTTDTADTKFNGRSVGEQLQKVLQKPFAKLCIVNSLKLVCNDHFTQREKNTVYQWYHIHSCFKFLNDISIQSSDIILRIRPDIRFTCSIDELLASIEQAKNYSGILIPKGNDIFHSEYRKYTTNPINDQISIGQYKYMKVYCSLYEHVNFSELTKPIISEELLSQHLSENHIQVQRINLPYRLCLSECRMVAITGDSGVGKSTLTDALRDVFPFDSNMIFETDRYHKWERGDSNWETLTHLNPEANYLEKMVDDTYLLKLGEQIQQVDYDHRTGTFTDSQEIESKKYVFLCGLHTLYKEDIRANIDLKIYVHTEHSLKRFWKIQRDMKKRGYTFEQCLEKFESRQEDYMKYILPQKSHADIQILYSPKTIVPSIFDANTAAPEIVMAIQISNTLSSPVIELISNFLIHVSSICLTKDDCKLYTIIDELNRDTLRGYIPPAYGKYIQEESLRPGYLGVVQILSILILLDPST
jgi:uridine kinase